MFNLSGPCECYVCESGFFVVMAGPLCPVSFLVVGECPSVLL